MKTVFQDDEYGCGAACVAMLADVPYERARKELFGTKSVRTIPKSGIMVALATFGITLGPSARLTRHQTLKSVKVDALVKGYVDNVYGHWMVWDAKQQVLRDPYEYKAPLRVTSFSPIERKRR